MRIVFLCNEYPPHPSVGGIGIFTHTIAHGLANAGHEVTVLGFGQKPGERDDGRVRVVVLPESTTRGIAWFVNRLRLFAWLKHKARIGQIDIIETPEYQGMLPFKFPWCPVVVRLHTSFLPKEMIQRLLEKRTLKLHANWIGVSRWVIGETKRKYNLIPAYAVVVYNSVSECEGDVVVSIELPDNFVLYAGTVKESKGAFVLAEAARTFLATHPDLHLVYAGKLIVENGKGADETIRRILGPLLSSRVHFVGPVNHDAILSCMKRARVFVSPSKLEAFSLVPLEAMCNGTPVVYSTLHSGPEAIDDGITGLLADPCSPIDVAEKVQRILSDSALGDQLAKNGKQAVQDRFSLQRCIDGTLQFYERCSLNRE